MKKRAHMGHVPFAMLPLLAVATVLPPLESRTFPRHRAHATPATPGAGDDGVRYAVTSTGNVARYRVREQLAGIDLPSDAVGQTSQVTGGISIAKDGKTIGKGSVILVELSDLVSDHEKRDLFVRERILQTDLYPVAELVPTAVKGFTLPPRAPDSETVVVEGDPVVELEGDLTLHRVTRQTIWRGIATIVGDTVSGTVTTRFAFADFGLTRPRVPIVLSVSDSITLEYQFRFARQRTSASGVVGDQLVPHVAVQPAQARHLTSAIPVPQPAVAPAARAQRQAKASTAASSCIVAAAPPVGSYFLAEPLAQSEARFASATGSNAMEDGRMHLQLILSPPTQGARTLFTDYRLGRSGASLPRQGWDLVGSRADRRFLRACQGVDRAGPGQ